MTRATIPSSIIRIITGHLITAVNESNDMEYGHPTTLILFLHAQIMHNYPEPFLIQLIGLKIHID